MIPISGGGAFTRQNIADINANFASINVDVYVDPQNGNNNENGLSAGSPKSTVAGFASILEPGIKIGIKGVLFEEYSSPNVAGVSLIGLGNQPLQATTGGAPNGGGTTWLSPSGGTGILLKLNGQGSRVQNIFFNNSAAQPCVQIMTSGGGDPPADPDGAHALILGCKFTGADSGVQTSGNSNFVTIDGCTFFNFTGTGDTGIEAVTGAGVGTLLGWQISNNRFYNNVNHVIMPTTTGAYFGNNFTVVGAAVTSTIALSLTGGAGNSVYNNMFNRPLNTSPNATLYVGGTNDVWSHNYGSDGLFYGVPDNS